ncbi:unnamed protein product [Adineta steineri]|uniref:Uncharacterized protein n=1 Tax=Adineta steineri TaxID=433720 RepID=A0A815JK65_9BILA|nr:unnamed protein product [Adineta steineri]CAF3619751.1 unnamed protein product [Adineta steineri]
MGRDNKSTKNLKRKHHKRHSSSSSSNIDMTDDSDVQIQRINLISCCDKKSLRWGSVFQRDTLDVLRPLHTLQSLDDSQPSDEIIKVKDGDFVIDKNPTSCCHQMTAANYQSAAIDLDQIIIQQNRLINNQIDKIQRLELDRKISDIRRYFCNQIVVSEMKSRYRHDPNFPNLDTWADYLNYRDPDNSVIFYRSSIRTSTCQIIDAFIGKSNYDTLKQIIDRRNNNTHYNPNIETIDQIAKYLYLLQNVNERAAVQVLVDTVRTNLQNNNMDQN